MMASAQVVETAVNTNNSPSQDYTTNPDDHSNHNMFLNCYFICEMKTFDFYTFRAELEFETVLRATELIKAVLKEKSV